MSVTIFSCGGPKVQPCVDCGEPRKIHTHGCTFALHGKKQGQLCARPLCAKCSATGNAMCRAHRNLHERQRAGIR